MKKILVAFGLAAFSTIATAQSAAPGAGHDHEHTSGGAAAPTASPAHPTPAARTQGRRGGMSHPGMMHMDPAAQAALGKLDDQIAALRAMHARLQAAASPDARRALLDEQMSLVQKSLDYANAAGGMAAPMPSMPSGRPRQPDVQMMPGGMPMADMPMSGGMSMMSMHRTMQKRVELLQITLQAIVDRMVLLEPAR